MTTLIVTKVEDLTAVMATIMSDIVASLVPQQPPVPPAAIELEKLKRKKALTTEEVAALYGLNAHTLRKHRVNATGPSYIKHGALVLYTHAAVKKYLESRRQKTIDQE